MSDKSFEELQSLVIQWAKDRKIIPNSTRWAQWKKTVQEVMEIGDALHEFETGAPNKGYKIAHEEFIDGIGDTMVCLINLAALCDLNAVDCLAHAYDQIKDRKGFLREDGIFVKEES